MAANSGQDNSCHDANGHDDMSEVNPTWIERSSQHRFSPAETSSQTLHSQLLYMNPCWHCQRVSYRHHPRAARCTSQLTGRTPARTNSLGHFPTLSSIMACGASVQWFAGAGSAASMGRRARGGLGWKKMVSSMTGKMYFSIFLFRQFYIFTYLQTLPH
jgi:hypothetical protein